MYFKQKGKERKMRPEIEIQHRGENQATGNVFLKVSRKRERKRKKKKKAAEQTGRTESEGRKERRQIKPDKK